MVSQAQSQDFLRTINIQGTGSVAGTPDLATVNTGVVTQAETADVALSDNNKQFENVLSVLKEKGIEQNDIQTTSFNINPRFERQPNATQGKIIGYEVTNRVQVKVRKIDDLGEILDALVTAGSNRISGISFSIADPTALRDDARKAAVEDAKRKAELYAVAAGVKVGKVLTISENNITQPSPNFRAASLKADSVPIAAGELSISASVFVLFEIVDA